MVQQLRYGVDVCTLHAQPTRRCVSEIVETKIDDFDGFTSATKRSAHLIHRCRLGSVLIFELYPAIALAWWSFAWRNGVLASIPPIGSNILLGLGVIQVLALVVLLFVLSQSFRGPSYA